MRLLLFVSAFAGWLMIADAAVAGSDVDPKTGMKFPARVPSFEREARVDFYLTFRVTYFASQANYARKQIDALVRGFKMP